MQNTTIHQLDVIIPHSQGTGIKTGTKTGEKGKNLPKYSARGYFLSNVEEAHLQCKRCVGKVQCEQQHLPILTRSAISVIIVLKQSTGPQLCLKAINWSSIGLIINPRRSIWIQSWNQDWKMIVYIPRKFSRETPRLSEQKDTMPIPARPSLDQIASSLFTNASLIEGDGLACFQGRG